MESVERLISAIIMVEEARGVPLSASCVVHRGDLLELLDESRNLLPQDFSKVQNLLATRESIIEEGHASAESLVLMAREEVSRMVEQTSIVQAARDEASRILAEVRETANRERDEVEAYIDARLATLEVILTKTADAVARGRERLAGAHENDVLSQLQHDN